METKLHCPFVSRCIRAERYKRGLQEGEEVEGVEGERQRGDVKAYKGRKEKKTMHNMSHNYGIWFSQSKLWPSFLPIMEQ